MMAGAMATIFRHSECGQGAKQQAVQYIEQRQQHLAQLRKYLNLDARTENRGAAVSIASVEESKYEVPSLVLSKSIVLTSCAV